jgi:hypothetical protein
MATPSKDHSKQILSPLIHKLLDACDIAFEAFQKENYSCLYKYSSRTKASILRDYIVFEMKRLEDEYANVRCVNKSGLTVLAIDEEVALRIKKMDKNLLTSNHSTTQSLAFESQQLNLPGIEGVTYLNLGYVMNKTGTNIDGVYITCPNGYKSIAWFIRLDEEIGTTVEVTELPLSTDTEKRRVAIRIKDELAGDRGESDEHNN